MAEGKGNPDEGNQGLSFLQKSPSIAKTERKLLNLYFTFFHLDATATEVRSQRHGLMEKEVLQGIRAMTLTNSGTPETADDWWEAGSLYYLCWKAESLLRLSRSDLDNALCR